MIGVTFSQVSAIIFKEWKNVKANNNKRKKYLGSLGTGERTIFMGCAKI